MTVPYTFATASGNIPLAELDANFAALGVYSNTAGTVLTNAQPNITTVGTVEYLSSTGNIIADYFVGNGSQLTGIVSVYGNANVQSYLSSGTYSANISTTGNITSSYIFGNGSQLTGIPVSYGNANVANYLPTYSGTITATNINVANTVTATTFVGNFQGNITGNLVVPGANTWVLYNNSGNAGADIGFTYNAATKNITVGNTVTANLFGGTLTTAAQPNITSVGTLSSLTVSGNTTVTSGMFKLPSYTTVQITALTGMTGGEFVYNSTLQQIQGYQLNPSTGSLGWVSLTVAAYQ